MKPWLDLIGSKTSTPSRHTLITVPRTPMASLPLPSAMVGRSPQATCACADDALSRRVLRGVHGRRWYQRISSHGLIYFSTPGGPVGGGGASRSCTGCLRKALPHPVMGSRWAEWGRHLRNFRCNYGTDRHQLDSMHLRKAPDGGPARRWCRGRQRCFGSKWWWWIRLDGLTG